MSCLIGCKKIDAIGEHTLVDELTAKYLADEAELWKVIEKREDRTLQFIYNVHTELLNRDFGESNVFLRATYFPNFRVTGSIMAINDTSHEIQDEFFEHRNYTALSIRATNGINLGKMFDSIYEETINSTEFWSTIKNVRFLLRDFHHVVQFYDFVSLSFRWNVIQKLESFNPKVKSFLSIIRIFRQSHCVPMRRHNCPT